MNAAAEVEAPDVDLPDFDLTDAQLRATRSVKWTLPPPDVLPAWVAEMDVRPCPAVSAALHRAVEDGVLGYPAKDAVTGLPEATARFLGDRFGWLVDPARLLLTGDVMAGVLLVLEALCEPAPVVVPVPAYPPFLDAVPLTRRRLVPVPCRAPDGPGSRPALDLEAIERELAAGARTVLISSPQNPLGRAFDATELAALGEAADRHGARVISDEIHAPLVLPGGRHVPYAGVGGRLTTTVLAASKAWNMPGLKCAQIVCGSDEDVATLRRLPLVANHGTSPLGITAAIAAYEDGGPWLDGLLVQLDARRTQFGELLREQLPELAWWPMEATYLAWVDARPLGLADPAVAALRDGRVMVSSGSTFGPGYNGFVRVNLGTSAERLERVVNRLASAWT